jgi:DNA-binding transcriptional ArsR family regulator
MKDPIKEQAVIFSVLADPTRLKLLKLLCNQHEPDALCVNAMVGLLGVSQPAISQHLRALKSVGLVKGERRGYHVHYSVDSENLLRYKSLVSDILTPGKQEQDDPCMNCPSSNKLK